MRVSARASDRRSAVGFAGAAQVESARVVSETGEGAA